MFRYFPYCMTALVERLTDYEFDPELWKRDPDMDQYARDLRDVEILLDLTGNIDSCA